MICTHIRVKEEGRGFNASNLGVWFYLRADPRKLKRKKVQNPTSAKIATLKNFPLYGSIYFHHHFLIIGQILRSTVISNINFLGKWLQKLVSFGTSAKI